MAEAGPISLVIVGNVGRERQKNQRTPMGRDMNERHPSWRGSLGARALALVALAGLSPSSAGQSSAQSSPTSPVEDERRVESLLGRMTLEEKLGQMSQTLFPKAVTDEIRDETRKGRWGSFFNGGTPEEKAEVQRIARKESRLGIPLLFGLDAIHGYRTVFPIPLGQSASWDPELVRHAARIAAREVSGDGTHWTFSPMIDVARDPRWGRIAESLGEDPYLSGVLGAAMVRGYQGDSLAAPGSIAACAKHYVGYGAAEGGRDYNTPGSRRTCCARST